MLRLPVPRFGQFWVMRDGSDGKCGTAGNGESATYTLPDPLVGSNPTLTAKLLSVRNCARLNLYLGAHLSLSG